MLKTQTQTQLTEATMGQEHPHDGMDVDWEVNPLREEEREAEEEEAEEDEDRMNVEPDPLGLIPPRREPAPPIVDDDDRDYGH